MKLKSLLLFILSSFFLVLSCGKEEVFDETPSTPETGEEFPDIERIPGAFLAYASEDSSAAQQSSEENTKAYPKWTEGDGSIIKVYWASDDRIKIYYDRSGDNYGEYVLASGADQQEGQFTIAKDEAGQEIKVGEEMGSFYAAYPASGVKGISSDGSVTVTLPNEQTVTATGARNSDQSAQLMMAYCGADRVLRFKQMTSFVKVGMTSPTLPGFYCYKVVVTSASQNIVGDIKMNYYSQTPTIVSNGSKTLTIHVEGKSFKALGTDIDNSSFIYFFMAPGTYDDLSFTFYLKDDSGREYTTIKDGTGQEVKMVRGLYRFFSMKMGTDLSAEETANCYLIKTPGVYCFDATVKGNGVVTLGATASGVAGTADASELASVAQYYSDGPNSPNNAAYVVNSDGATFIDRFDLTNGGYFLSDGKVYFKTAATLAPGTSLVSVKDNSGTTLWSWHIWCNPNVADVSFGGYTFMNLCLGSHLTKPNSYNLYGFMGYYYQWGRKDPIQQAKGVASVLDAPFVSHAGATDGTLLNSIKNPHIFYGGYTPGNQAVGIYDWAGPGEGNLSSYTPYFDWWCKDFPSTSVPTANHQAVSVAMSKTMFDPCPPGYHVPTVTALLTIREATIASYSLNIANHYLYAKDANDKYLYFPATASRQAGITASYYNGYSGSDYQPTHYMWSYCPGSATARDYTHTYASRFWVTSTKVESAGSSGYNYKVERANGALVRCQKE